MSKFIIFTLLVSAFVVYGFNSPSMAAGQSEDPRVLIKCSTCGVEFTSLPLAEHHVIARQGHEVAVSADPLIKCTTCGVEFTSQAGLKKHLQMKAEHQVEPLIQCSTCGVEFTSPELWKQHLKAHPNHKIL